MRNVDLIDDVISSTQLNNTVSCHQPHTRTDHEQFPVHLHLPCSKCCLINVGSTVNVEETDSEEDYGVIRLGANARY